MPPPPALRRNYTVCGLLHDRTEEERDNQLADILGYKFAVVDARSGAILECAEALAETIGVPQHRLCGERLADWLEDGAARARLEAALASGEALSEMVRLRGADGAPGVLGELNLPVDSVCLADAARWRLCLLVESPTEAAELQLQRLATCLRLPMPVAPRLRETLGRLQRTFIVTDPNLDDNPIVFASEAFCEMTGYAREELVGRNCRLLQGPGTDLSVIRKVRHAARDGRACTAELLNYRKDGSAFKNLLHFAPVRDPAGAVSYFVGVQTDLTALVDEEQLALGVLPSAPLLRPRDLATLAAEAEAEEEAAAAAADSGMDTPPWGGAASPAVPAAAGGRGTRLPPAMSSTAALVEEARRTAASVDSALSQHLRDVLKASVLMHTAG